MDEIIPTECRCTEYSELKSSTLMKDEQIERCIELGIIKPVMIGDTQYYRYNPDETDRMWWTMLFIKWHRAILGY